MIQKRTSLSFQRGLYTLGFSAFATCHLWLKRNFGWRLYDAVTQLREIPARKSPFLEVHPAQGVTTWVPTHAPQPLVMCPGNISTFFSYHACRIPPGTWPSPGPYLSQRFSKGGVHCRVSTPYAWVLHESGLSLRVLGVWLWSHLSLLFITLLRYRGPRPPRPFRGLLPCRPLHGLPYPWVSGGGAPYLWAHPMVPPPPRSLQLVGIGRWRPSDVRTPWLRPSQRPRPDHLPSRLPVPSMGPTKCWLWSTPVDGSVQKLIS